MQSLVIATGNLNKLKEINAKLSAENIILDTLLVKQPFDPDETGKTFSENAYIKAFEAAKIMNAPALGDDSGLCIDALDGAPGIFSSRYADTNEKRIQRVLSELKNIEFYKRSARFVCTLALVDPQGNTIFSCEGKCEGKIISELKGNQGFGYDPIFYIENYKKTMAELSMNEKNTISHRSDALNQFISWLKTKGVKYDS